MFPQKTKNLELVKNKIEKKELFKENFERIISGSKYLFILKRNSGKQEKKIFDFVLFVLLPLRSFLFLLRQISSKKSNNSIFFHFLKIGKIFLLGKLPFLIFSNSAIRKLHGINFKSTNRSLLNIIFELMISKSVFYYESLANLNDRSQQIISKQDYLYSLLFYSITFYGEWHFQVLNFQREENVRTRHKEDVLNELSFSIVDNSSITFEEIILSNMIMVFASSCLQNFEVLFFFLDKVPFAYYFLLFPFSILVWLFTSFLDASCYYFASYAFWKIFPSLEEDFFPKEVAENERWTKKVSRSLVVLIHCLKHLLLYFAPFSLLTTGARVFFGVNKKLLWFIGLSKLILSLVSGMYVVVKHKEFFLGFFCWTKNIFSSNFLRIGKSFSRKRITAIMRSLKVFFNSFQLR